MVDFSSQAKRQEVQRVLTSRMNQFCLSNINPRDRGASRAAFCTVVWVIPSSRSGKFDVKHAFPVIGKDISARGLSLVHNAPVIGDPLVIGLHDKTGPCFISCSIEHCTSLGYGFYQIGLRPEEMVTLRDNELDLLNRRLAQFSPSPTKV
ncbi:MAG: hypothetical protein WD648_04245 [Planctomycetaceae bacterium]